MSNTRVRIGRVTDVKGAKVHLFIRGSRHCATLARRSGDLKDARGTNQQGANLCKHCFTPERVDAARKLVNYGAWNRRLDDQLWHVRQELRTPAEIAREQELINRTKQPTQLPAPAPKPRTFAEIRAAFAAALNPAA